MKSPVLRGALIGAGDISEYHMRAWENISQVRILAVADPDLGRARQRAVQAGLPITCAHAYLSDLLQAEPNLDFLDITAPPEVRQDLVSQAAARGLHIICQKPFAPSLAEARQMMGVCQQAGVMLVVHENWRWRPWYRAIREMVAAGKIGRPFYARIFGHSDSWVAGRVKEGHRNLYGDKVVLYDYGVHHLDLMRFLFGEPTSLYARLGKSNPRMRGEGQAIVLLNYLHMTALVDISFSSYAPQGFPRRKAHPIEDFRLEGDAGTIQTLTNAEGQDVIRLTNDQGVSEQPAYSGDAEAAYLASFQAAQEHFIDCLLNCKTPETAAADNYESLALVMAAYHAGETGQVVQISDFKEAY
jgi:predicted dehydrogenase